MSFQTLSQITASGAKPTNTSSPAPKFQTLTQLTAAKQPVTPSPTLSTGTPVKTITQMKTEAVPVQPSLIDQGKSVLNKISGVVNDFSKTPVGKIVDYVTNPIKRDQVANDFWSGVAGEYVASSQRVGTISNTPTKFGGGMQDFTPQPNAKFVPKNNSQKAGQIFHNLLNDFAAGEMSGINQSFGKVVESSVQGLSGILSTSKNFARLEESILSKVSPKSIDKVSFTLQDLRDITSGKKNIDPKTLEFYKDISANKGTESILKYVDDAAKQEGISSKTKVADYVKDSLQKVKQGIKDTVNPNETKLLNAGDEVPTKVPGVVSKIESPTSSELIKPELNTTKIESPQITAKVGNRVGESPIPSSQAQIETPTSVGERGGLKVSKIAKSIEANAIESKLTMGFKDLAGYDPITIKDQSERASAVINSGIDNARAIIRGEAPLPEGLKGTALIKGMEDYLEKNPNKDIVYELANSNLVTGTSEAAQELRLAAERDPYSITSIIDDVNKARETKYYEATGKSSAQAKSEVVKSIKEGVRKSIPSIDDWADFVREVECGS